MTANITAHSISDVVRNQTIKMDFKYNYCPKKFNDSEKTINHFKNIHKISENNERIPCIVNFSKPDCCNRSYLSFKALRLHVKSCIKVKHERDKIQVKVEQND